MDVDGAKALVDEDSALTARGARDMVSAVIVSKGSYGDSVFMVCCG